MGIDLGTGIQVNKIEKGPTLIEFILVGERKYKYIPKWDNLKINFLLLFSQQAYF